jgi:hypothetical protein
VRLSLLGLGLLFCSPDIFADGILHLKGKVFSLMPEVYIIESGPELIELRKSSLPEDLRTELENSNTRAISLGIPMSAIVRIRRSPATR